MTGGDEIGQLGRALDASTEAIATMVRQVGDNADMVASASAEAVSYNVQTVAAGAEETGGSIQEIAVNAGEAARVAAPRRRILVG